MGKFLDEVGLAELWKLTTDYADSGDENLKAYADAMFTRSQTGSYTGTGKMGQSNAISLTFDFVPKFFVVIPPAEASVSRMSNTLMWAGQNGTAHSYNAVFTVSGTTLSWYSSSGADYMCNKSGETYCWVAIG